jgi:serine/threonine protein kinase
MTNTQHLGDYVLTEQLRQDRTGTVFRGVHDASKKPVAIKILPEKHANDPDLIARFARDASKLASLKHPGIVEVLDHGESSQGLYLVLEDLAGETLADRLKRDGQLPLAETLRVVGAVASALAAAHRVRIVHRDLTPDSIFLAQAGPDGDPGGVVKVMDLGLAKLLGDPSAPGRKGVDQRADIHALGRLAYQMLSGQEPVQEDAGHADPAGERKRPPRLSAHGVTVPSSVESAILKALDRKKKRRFNSMTEFAQALGVAITPAAVATSTPAPEAEPEIELELEPGMEVEPVPELELEPASELDLEPASELELEPVPEPAPVAARVTPPPLPPPRSAQSTASPVAAVSARVREAGRTAIRRPRTVAAGVAASAAAVAIGWFALRSDGPPARPTVAVNLAPPPRVDVARAPKPSPSAGLPTAPTRVDEILALNQRAVDAHAQSDFKAAGALLQEADKLALASGYEAAPVRAQTQVRLGALYLGQNNPRVGRRYLAKAVAINPAVRIPAGMLNPHVHKALIAEKKKARSAKNAAEKRLAKSQPQRRHGRDLKQQR